MFFNVWLHSLIMFLRLAHVVANITISFLFPVKSSIIWMYYISFIQLASAGGPDGSFLIPQQGFSTIHPFLVSVPLVPSVLECFP